MGKSCFDRFKEVLKIPLFIASCVGLNVLDPKFRVNIITRSGIALIFGFFLLTVYTMYHGFVIEGDWKIILQSLSVVGSGFQGVSKIIMVLSHKPLIRRLYGRIDNIYLDLQYNEDYKQALNTQLIFTVTFLKAIAAIVTFTIIVLVAYPLIYGYINGVKLIIVQVSIPGVDPKTENGYTICSIVHVFFILFAGYGNCAGDMLIFVGIIHMPLLKDVFIIKCKILSEVIASNSKNSKDKKETKALLLDVLNWHQVYNAYLTDAVELYYFVIFVQIFSAVMSICCTLFSIITKSWPAAIVFCIFSVIALYAYCGLGNLVDLANDQIIETIYCDITWYELPAAEQKLVLQMLRKSQKKTSLTVGPIMPLSMSSALQLTKCIYSYMMMLMNLLDGDEM